MFRLLGRWLRAILATLLTLLVPLVAYVGFLYATLQQQEDDRAHLETKKQYLQQLASSTRLAPDAPNIIFFLYDDMGYGDIGAGVTNPGLIATPNLDRLAAQGVTLSDFHSPSPVCTPARAGYLTGRLAPRAGLPDVVFPTDRLQGILPRLGSHDAHLRLPAEEITLADVLGAAGYRTGMIGKWHLGDRSPSLPNDMGFGFFYGALYSNDMQPFAWYRNRSLDTPAPADQTRMTEVYTREALAFIEQDSSQPFFLYFAHNFPHDPLHVRDARRGLSGAGLYGDVLEEIDEGVGQILDALRRRGELENTLILVTSDNGPWFLGDAGSQRGRKGSTFEGGQRVPFIAHWPARIPGGRTEPAMAMGTDLLPTLLQILDLPPPGDRSLDGRSILPVLTQGGETPHDYLYYYDSDQLFAVRDERFKYRGAAGVSYATDATPLAFRVPQKEWLFDLENDPREAYDASDNQPQPLARLRQVFEAKQAEMRGNLRGWH